MSAVATGWRDFWRRDRKGSAALEFALLFPVLVLMVGGTLELGIMLMADASLEMGVRAASRYGITVNSTGVSRSDAIKSIIESYVKPWLPAGVSLTVTEKVYTSYANVGQPEPFTDLNGNGTWDPGEPYTDVNGNGRWDDDQGLASDGGSGDIVVYEASFTRPDFIGFLSMMGIHSLTFDRRVLVQNE